MGLGWGGIREDSAWSGAGSGLVPKEEEAQTKDSSLGWLFLPIPLSGLQLNRCLANRFQLIETALGEQGGLLLERGSFSYFSAPSPFFHSAYPTHAFDCHLSNARTVLLVVTSVGTEG